LQGGDKRMTAGIKYLGNNEAVRDQQVMRRFEDSNIIDLLVALPAMPISGSSFGPYVANA
jgi:hypothetical protein